MASAPDINQNVLVKVTVVGDKQAINALAGLERAQAQHLRAQNAAARGTSALTTATTRLGQAQRGSTQASIQAGQQLQDFAIQVQGGQNILVAFSQQLSQLAIVSVNAGGALGTVARFFTGPWGTAVFLATAVLTPFISKLFETAEATDEVTAANERFIDSYKNANAVMRTRMQIELNALRDQRSQAEITLQRFQGYDFAPGLHGSRPGLATEKELAAINLQIAERESGIRAVEAAEAALAREQEKSAKSTRASAEATAHMNRELSALDQMYNSIVASAEATTSKFALQTKVLERLDQAYRRGAMSYSIYRSAVEGIRDDRASDMDRDKPTPKWMEVGNIPIAGTSTERLNEQLVTFTEGLGEVQIQASKTEEMFASLAVNGIGSIANELNAAIEGSKSLGEAFEDMGKLMIRTLTELAVKYAAMQLIFALIPGGGSSSLGAALAKGLGFAKGGVFENGQMTAFANGGIVSQPTLFPMARGMGLMGEAGPEAIIPLTRGPDGKLGVASTAPNVIINNNVGAEVSAGQNHAGDLVIMIEHTRRAIASDINRGDGMISRSLQGTYGLTRGARR